MTGHGADPTDPNLLSEVHKGADVSPSQRKKTAQASLQQIPHLGWWAGEAGGTERGFASRSDGAWGSAPSQREGVAMVDVEFNLMLVELAGRKTTTLEIGEKVSLMELIRLAGLNEDDVGMQLINKQWAPFESIVNDGDRVQLYPFLEGG
ncbi:MAG: hypothetical protein LBH09_05350 [Peptococcaceae bacterium]|nr:hypothetical protein [Peptococcaceae bacterium]